MKTPRVRLAAVIADRALEGENPKRLSREVAAYLIGEHRTGELESLLRDVRADLAEAGYVEIVAASARPLGNGAKAQIIARGRQLYPTAKQISLSEVRDPAVIGGVRLTLANRQLDLSVEAKLNKFKQLTGKD